MATIKNEIQLVFKKRVKALGISIVSLATITGYKKSTLYGISSGNAAPTDMLWANIKLFEILQNLGVFQTVLDQYGIKQKGSVMTPSTKEDKQQQIQKLNEVLNRAEEFKSALAAIANLDIKFADIYSEIKTIHDELKNDSQE